MKNFINEFKEFAFRGNVLDLAVGVVIGAAFTTIVTSLVEDIIMPLVGMLTGGNDISALSVKVGTAKLAYGSFLQAIINLGNLLFFKREIPAAEQYLKDIRDLLAKETIPTDLP